MKKTYDILITKLKEFGPLRIDAVKTSINLISKHHFGSLTIQSKCLRLGFVSDEVIVDPRIIHRQKLGKSRMGYSVRLNSPYDIDNQLLGWLKKAYLLQS